MNTQVTQEIREAFKIQVASEKVPNAMPVIEVGTKMVKNCLSATINAYNATSVSMLTASSSHDTYIIGATLSLIKDVTATSTGSAISYTDENGLSSSIIKIAGLTLTAQQADNSIMLTHPIKLKRGTNVVVTNSTNVGNVSATGVIFYYIDEQGNQ